MSLSYDNEVVSTMSALLGQIINIDVGLCHGHVLPGLVITYLLLSLP